MRRNPLVAAVITSVAALVVSCGSSSTDAQSNSPEPTDTAVSDTPAAGSAILNIAGADGVTTWDPIASFSTEVGYMANIYEPLIYAVKSDAQGNTEFRPGLAESWEPSNDGATWTFTLRDGVTFHDGETLTSEAVKQSIEATAADGGASFIWAALDSIETPDPATVVINMTSPQPVDLIASSENGAWITSVGSLEKRAEDPQYFDKEVTDAGTGPYTLDSYVSGKQVVLKKFDDYWGGWDDDQYSTLNFSINPEATVAEQALQSGDAQVLVGPNLKSVDHLKSQGYNIFTFPTTYTYHGFFNTTRAPLDDPKVRQALSYAVPYDEILAVGASGYGTLLRGAVPEGIFPYSDDVPQYHQDLDKARDLLAEAGHEGGGFTLNLTYTAGNIQEENFAPLLKDAFAKVGVTLNIQGVLWNQQWEQGKGDPAQAQDIFVVLYWPTYSDGGSDNLQSLFHSSDEPYFNLSYWDNEQFDTLVDDATAIAGTDKAKALSLYTEAQTLMMDEAPAIQFYSVEGVAVTDDSVTGLEWNINYPAVTFYYPARQTS